MKIRGIEKTLLVKLEDKDLLNLSKEFLKDIEEGFGKFNKILAAHEKDMSKYTSSSDYIFDSERLMKRSPLTIINAPWGTGKTYFIENFLKLFIDKKISSKIFSKMIIIDAWKFSNSKDVSLEFSEELARKILKSLSSVTEDGVAQHVIKKFMTRILPSSLSFQFNLGFVSFGSMHGIKNDSIEKNEEKNVQKIWDKIENNKIPTIIFIDNLERLGTQSWDLLKAILKLQEFRNYLVVLPMNINKLKNHDNNKNSDNSEYPIEKYVDFRIYNFEQGYSHYFSLNYKNTNLVDRLNQIFSTSISGEKMSIREVEKSFIANNLVPLHKKTEYEIFKIVKKEIWNPGDIFEKFVIDDFKTLVEHERRKREIYYVVTENILQREGMEYINASKAKQNQINGSDDDIISSSGRHIIYRFGFDYLGAYEGWLKSIVDKELELNLEIKGLGDAIDNNKKEIENLLKKIKTLNSDVRALEEKIRNEKLRKVDFDAFAQTELERLKKNSEDKITELNNDVRNYTLKIEESERESTKRKLTISKIFKNINHEIEKLREINLNEILDKEKKREIMMVLEERVSDLDTEFSRYHSDFENRGSWLAKILI